MIITITGKPGSGKSTVGKMVAKELGYDYISVGDIRGEIAKKHNMTIDELNKIGETEDWTDVEVDEQTKDIGKTRDNIIIDGRTAYHFAPDSFKIFIDCDTKVAAQRIFNDPRDDEKKEDSIEALEQTIIDRHESDRQRYLKWYKLDVNDLEPFDLLIDSSELDQKIIAESILTVLKN